jgi:hypothetical protein
MHAIFLEHFGSLSEVSQTSSMCSKGMPSPFGTKHALTRSSHSQPLFFVSQSASKRATISHQPLDNINFTLQYCTTLDHHASSNSCQQENLDTATPGIRNPGTISWFHAPPTKRTYRKRTTPAPQEEVYTIIVSRFSKRFLPSNQCQPSFPRV